MKRMLATTALALTLGLPALAQTSDMRSPFFDTSTMQVNADLRASELIGMRIYTSEIDVDTWGTNEIDKDWNDIGEINDVLLSRDGQTIGVLVDIGGFLGLGEHTVALDMSQLNLVADGDDPGDFFVVLNTTKEALENSPEFDVDYIGHWMQGPEAESGTAMNSDSAATTDTAATQSDPTATTTTEMAATDSATTGMVQSPATTPAEGYALVEPDKMTAEELDGARVYDANDEWIGEVSQIVVADDGKIETLVVDVGGFLGIGEKPVGLSYETFKLQQATDTGEVRAHISSTKEELEAMPEFEG